VAADRATRASAQHVAGRFGPPSNDERRQPQHSQLDRESPATASHILGGYVLGVECDGATYHSSKSARDRDRLRQDVLENLNWRIHRVWSTDWYRDPEREFGRLVQNIERFGPWHRPRSKCVHPVVICSEA
jgi:hypothetical protein